MRVVRAAVLLALCAVFAAGCGKKHHNTLVLKVVGKADEHQLDETATILRRRIDLLGINEAELRRRPPGRFVITTRRALTGAQRRVLTKPGSLALYDLEADLAPASTNGYLPRPSRRLDALLARAHAGGEESGSSEFVLVDSHGQLIGAPAPTRPTAKPGTNVRSVPAHTTVVSCPGSTGCPGTGAREINTTFYYLFQYYPDRTDDPIPELTGRDLDASRIGAGFREHGQNALVIGFTPAGNRAFRQITQTEAVRGQALADAAGLGGSTGQTKVIRFAQHFAVVLDGKLLAAPYIDYKQDPEGIDATRSGAEIANIPTYAEATNLDILLRGGALPLRLVVAG